MRHVLPMFLGAALVSACGDDPTGVTEDATGADAAPQAAFGPAASATYTITITNLTDGQPFTPPLGAAHRKPVSLFTVGAPASFELKEIAENGNLAPMVARLEGDAHVTDVMVAAGTPAPLLPGQSISFELTVERGAKYMSWVSMLICTNDGFTGVDGLRLPKQVGETVTLHTDAYDAGTEINTEDFADLVPPCPELTGVPSGDAGSGTSNPALAEGDRVRHHPGIQGIADLVPAIHGWQNPVATIVVERKS